MSKNLIFIMIEEKDITYDVSSNFVRLYMNRCIIDEDDQFEILGVVCLIYDDFYNPYGLGMPYLEGTITDGIKMASEILNKSFESRNYETHLIVGLPIPLEWGSWGISISHGDFDLGEFRSRLNVETPNNIYSTLRSIFLSSVSSGLKETILKDFSKYSFLRSVILKENILEKFSSLTILNDWRSRIINNTKLIRKHTDQKIGQDKQTIYQDVDDFHMKLSGFKFLPFLDFIEHINDIDHINHVYHINQIACERHQLHRSKLMPDTQNSFCHEDYADIRGMRQLQISDSETYYVEYLGSRFTYFIEPDIKKRAGVIDRDSDTELDINNTATKRLIRRTRSAKIRS